MSKPRLIADDIKETDCCGIFEITGLGFEGEDNDPRDWDAGDPVERGFIPGRGYTATTTQRQKEEAKALKALGFEAVKTFKNSNTGNMVTFWFYHHPLPEKKKKG